MVLVCIKERFQLSWFRLKKVPQWKRLLLLDGAATSFQVLHYMQFIVFAFAILLCLVQGHVDMDTSGAGDRAVVKDDPDLYWATIASRNVDIEKNVDISFDR